MRTLSLVEVEQVSGAGIIVDAIADAIGAYRNIKYPCSGTVTRPNTGKPKPSGSSTSKPKPPKLEPEPCWMFGW